MKVAEGIFEKGWRYRQGGAATYDGRYEGGGGNASAWICNALFFIIPRMWSPRLSLAMAGDSRQQPLETVIIRKIICRCCTGNPYKSCLIHHPKIITVTFILQSNIISF